MKNKILHAFLCAQVVALMLASQPALAEGNHALSFNGTQQFGQAPVVPFLDNLFMDVWLDWNGPNGNGVGQTVLYNGQTALSGWGIFLADSGQVGVLVGGVDVLFGNVTMVAGTWHQVRVSRIGGVFTLEVDGVEYPLSNQATPNPLGQCGCQEALLVGNGSGVFDNPQDAPDGYNGVLDNIRIAGVGQPPKARLLFWHLDEGAGSTATDIHGNIMTLSGNPAWVQGLSLSSNLLAHWKFNEGTGTTTEDSSGNENDGTLLSGTPGGPIPLWVTDTPPIRHDRFALAFDGSQSGPFVQAPTLAISNTLSITAWVKFQINPGDDTTQGIVSEPRPGTGWALRMEYAFDNQGNFTPRANFGLNNDFINCSVHSIPQLPAGQWTHLAVTYEDSADPGVVTLYMNGQAVPVDAQCGTPGFIPITGLAVDIGREFPPTCCGTRTFDGSIDEVRIYNRILTADEVRQLARRAQRDDDDGGDGDDN